MVTVPVRPSRVTHSHVTSGPSFLEDFSKNRLGVLDRSYPEDETTPRAREGDPFPLDAPHQVSAKSRQMTSTTSPSQVT
jgi:hypothetical protein